MTWEVRRGDCIEVMRTLPEASVDAIVCDPPYGLSSRPDMAEVLRHWLDGDDYEHRGSGFMGKSWDSFVPGPAMWREAHRVLKPGGHLLAFFGTRTYDLGTLAIRLAGFEVRDCLAWMYGSGFPKSLDVSKAIDKTDAAEERQRRNVAFTTWMRSTGVTSKQLDAATNSYMGGHYLTDREQAAVPTADMFDRIRPLVSIDVPEWVEALIRERTVESENFKRRAVVGERTTGIGTGGGSTPIMGDSENRDVTAPATPDAERWQGWGTALKPAFEPIVLARKPLGGTVAANVLEHGTGALNVDGCRVGEGGHLQWSEPRDLGYHGGTDSPGATAEQAAHGRWPANVLLDPEAAAMLDEQTGNVGGNHCPRDASGTNAVYGAFAERPDNSLVGYDDHGGASRFFYCAKASSAERNAGLDGFAKAVTDDGRQTSIDNPFLRGETERRNVHPTVKPIDLMRWLVRLVTPPGGTVLDPFTGSGTTGCAAVLEGFGFLGLERESEYADIAEARIRWWAEQPAGIAVDDALEGNAKRTKVADTGQLDLLGGT